MTTLDPNALPFQPKSRITIPTYQPQVVPTYDQSWNTMQYYNSYPIEERPPARFASIQRAASGGIERTPNMQKNMMIKKYPSEGFNGGRYRGRGQYPPTPVPSLTPFFSEPEITFNGPPSDTIIPKPQSPSDDLMDAAYESDYPPFPATQWCRGYPDDFQRYSIDKMIEIFHELSRNPENIPKPEIPQVARITCLEEPDYSIELRSETGNKRLEGITVFNQTYFTKTNSSTGPNTNPEINTQEEKSNNINNNAIITNQIRDNDKILANLSAFGRNISSKEDRWCAFYHEPLQEDPIHSVQNFGFETIQRSKLKEIEGKDNNIEKDGPNIHTEIDDGMDDNYGKGNIHDIDKLLTDYLF